MSEEEHEEELCEQCGLSYDTHYDPTIGKWICYECSIENSEDEVEYNEY